MPGTLVEEAALRREIFLAGQVDDFDKFETLAMRVFPTLRHSIYAGNFRQRFALSVARFSFAQQADRFPRLVAVLDHLDRASQRALYLLIARTALVRGKIDMTDLAAERIAGADGRGKSRTRARARFYRAAARVVTEATREGSSGSAAGSTRAGFPSRTQSCWTAALLLGRDVRKATSCGIVAARRVEREANLDARADRLQSPRAQPSIERRSLLDELKEQLKERDR